MPQSSNRYIDIVDDKTVRVDGKLLPYRAVTRLVISHRRRGYALVHQGKINWVEITPLTRDGQLSNRPRQFTGVDGWVCAATIKHYTAYRPYVLPERGFARFMHDVFGGDPRRNDVDICHWTGAMEWLPAKDRVDLGAASFMALYEQLNKPKQG